ncbi:MAG: hypothetical protein KDD44_14770, partial [Bdellovibrionales bacterium]|nr:hypothetical protein [Bdellovibrionales bacterium]
MRLNTSNYLPEEVFVQRASLEDPLTERILARLAESGQPVPVRILDERGDPSSELDLFDEKGLTEAERFSRGKRRLLLTRHLGDWLRACPGTSHHVCCNLWTVNPGEGCPLDCSYCYLQSYLRRNPTLKLYTNTSAMLEEIRQRTQADPERYYRIGTGEVIDSLVWDRLSDASLELVPFFASLPNAVLELKTKTDFVENLLALAQEHKG